MQTPASPKNNLLKSFAAIGAVALGLAAAGCGNDSDADLVNGKVLFVEKCGACHQMARAGTAGLQGPNLDDAFRRARIDGMGDTIEGVTLGQIAHPSPDLDPKTMNMPADLVEGMDARDVAAYVAFAAAHPGKDLGALEAAGGGTDGASMFKTNCGSCHTLADAGTSGTSGPNLDTLKPDVALLLKQIANGGNGMPAFKGTLTAEQIEMISKYVAGAAGK